MQYFQKLIQKDLGFGYAFKDPIVSHDRADVWALHHGVSKENGAPALVLSFEPAKARPSTGFGGPSKQELAKGALQRLKTLRHPDVLKYLSSVEGSDGTIYAATEPAIPLATALQGAQPLDKEAIQWGLFTISRALGFMHQSGLIHGRVNATTVFVTPSGDWKLGGLEAVTQHANAAALGRYMPMQTEPYRSPEFANGRWNDVATGPAHAVDSWALGCLMYEAHAGSLTAPDQLRNTQAMPKQLLSAYQKLLSAQAGTRAPAGEVPNHPYFKNSKFIELNMFVENLALKGQLEREAFLGKLPTLMDRLPDSFCTFKVLPMLSQSIEMGAGASSAFACVVKMKSRLNEQNFAKNVVQKYAAGWYSNSALDRSLRIELYAHIAMFIDHFDTKTVNNSVFPAMCSAFQDMQTPALRDGAVKAVLSVAEALNEKNLNSVLMSHFARLQVDPEPAIRTNTTVCLGKLAAELTPSARGKVLIPAFLRALKDPFPPARAAGVNAIMITRDMYSVKDIATRVLPAVCPLLVDNANDVRGIAFKVQEGFLAKLVSNHDTMTRNAANEPTPVAPNGAAGGPQTGAAAGSSWGLSSFSGMAVALLSKGDTSADKTTATSTGISSDHFKNQKRAGSTASAPYAAPKPAPAPAPLPAASLMNSAPVGGAPAPAAFSTTPLTANALSLQPDTDFGAFGDMNAALDDDNDADGWGDMEIRTPGKADDPNEEDMFVSMMAPTGRARPPAKPIRGSSSKLSMSSRTDSTGSVDLWSVAPPTGAVPPKPRVATNATNAAATLETQVRRTGAASRKKKNSGGDDWEAFLGSAGTTSKRKPGSRLGGTR